MNWFNWSCPCCYDGYIYTAPINTPVEFPTLLSEDVTLEFNDTIETFDSLPFGEFSEWSVIN